MVAGSPGASSGPRGKTGPTDSWARTPAAQAAALPAPRAHGDDPQPGCTHPSFVQKPQPFKSPGTSPPDHPVPPSLPTSPDP